MFQRPPHKCDPFKPAPTYHYDTKECMMAHSNDPAKWVPDKEWTPAEREALGHAFDMAGGFVEQRLGAAPTFRRGAPTSSSYSLTIALAFTDRLRELRLPTTCLSRRDDLSRGDE
jgi:hypothetical protein